MKAIIKTFRLFIVIVVLVQIISAAVPYVQADDVLLPKGTHITLRLNDTLSTASNMEGDEFTATVVNPVYYNDRVVISRGSVVTGSVSRILRPDRLKGKAVLDLMLQSIRVPGYKPANIVATLDKIDATGSDGASVVDNSSGREKSAGGDARSGSASKIGVRPQSPTGKTSGASGGLPSVFNSQGDDLRIPRNSSISITLDRPLTLVEETGKPVR